jgi:hypothetical protein
MNSPLVIEQVRNVVNRDAFQSSPSDEERVKFLYELFFQRMPNETEMQAGKAFVNAFQAEAAAPAANAPAGRGADGARGRGARGAQAGQGRGAQTRGRGAAPAVPAQVRVPLSAWQEYAHALLMTNEAAFVN